MFLSVCKQTFYKSHVRISQKVEGVLMWNLQHIIFIWRGRHCQISQSALVSLTDLFLESEDDNISSYADDTTPYSWAQNISSVISELQRIAQKNFDWCNNNNMKANPG